ncbi:MAG: carbon-nitrogen hydrolase family protein [Thermoplasmatota archaeon]
MKLRVACVQTLHATSFEETLANIRPQVRNAAQDGARVILLPEYFFVPESTDAPRDPPTEWAPAVRAFLAENSRDHHVALVGNVIEKRAEGILNIGLAYSDGRLTGEQPKIHPMPREEAWQIRGGTALTPFSLEGIPAGLLVCADILYPEASRILSLKGAELILNPVMSPYLDVDPTREARSALYIARAFDAGAFVLKSGGYAPISRRAVGRSLIASPWGILAQSKSEWTSDVVLADLDFDSLHTFRATSRGLAGRSPSAYRDLAT